MITISRQVMNPPADEAEAGNLANTAPRQSDSHDARRGETELSCEPEARPVTLTARTLLDQAIDVMSELHRSIEPMEDDPELAGRVPPAAMRKFVDALAQIDYQRCRLTHAVSGNEG